VDWANAEKLTVRLEYPSAWGTSNPVQGALTPVMDIRKDYEFNIEFTPDTTHTLNSWLVFKTSDLTRLTDSGSWVENPNLIDANKSQMLGHDDVTPPEVIASGGTFKFTIHTAEPVTIVPWCDTQPRITLTEPRNSPDGKPYSRATDIVLYFNGALNDETVKFADDEDSVGIWITSEKDGIVTTNKDKGWFLKPEYAASGGFFTVIMRTSSNLPPEKSLMTVTVKGINNMKGESMDEAGYPFSWNTSAAVNIKLNSYTAAYADNSISISWTQTGADSVKTYYRLNNGGNNTLTNANNMATINGVNKLNDSDVLEGTGVSGIEEYAIFIELYKDEIMESRTTFKIWNFPGMSVSNTNPVVEVRTAAELAAIKDGLSKQYVLANDITVSSDTFTGKWMPVGTATATFTSTNPNPIINLNTSSAFKGKFYGNGHTITLESDIGGEGCIGLFGCTQNAVIRDFTLEYNVETPINVAANFPEIFEIQNNKIGFKVVKIGGVAGYLKDTKVCNIITSGKTLKVTSKPIGGSLDVIIGNNIGIDSPDGGVLLGGIAGMVEGSGKIENCRATLSTEYTSTGKTLLISMGAIAGLAGAGDTNNILSVNGLNTSDNSLSRLLIDGVTIAADVIAKNLQDIFGGIGGAVGMSRQNTLNKITFTSGTVSFSRVYGIDYETISICGGIVGMNSRANLVDCSFLSNINITAGTDSIIGGLLGQNETDGDSYNKYYINNCRIRGDIILSGSNSRPHIGGVLGESYNINPNPTSTVNSKMYITNCNFGGNIKVLGSSNITNVGGFCGGLEGTHNMDNCGTFKGTITVAPITYNISEDLEIGGFMSKTEGEISNCFSQIDINVEGGPSHYCNIGGFTGRLTSNGKIVRCYATGTINVITNNSRTEGDNYKNGTAVGGLVGIYEAGEIQNSYALGNVLVSDSGTKSSNAGGLVGLINQSGANISNCFSAGRVNAQSTTKEAYSGGIVGYNKGGSINNTVALGASVTALGSTKTAGRIYGSSNNSLVLTAKNYALNTMSVEEGVYGSINPTQPNLTSGLNKKDGQDTNSSTFFNQAFWRTTLGFPELISKVPVWNFSRVAIDGYPRLAWEE